MRVIIDTKPLLKLFKGERDGKSVQRIIDLIEHKKIEGFLSTITLTEIYYIYFRKNEKLAEERVEQIRFSRMNIVPIEENVSLQAGRFKGKYAIPISDSLIAASAFLLDAVIISDDIDFKKVKEIKVMDEKEFLRKGINKR